MKSWTVPQRIAVSFGLIVVLMGAMGFFAYTRLTHIASETGAVRVDSLPGLRNAAALETAWSTEFEQMQRWALVQESSERQRLESALVSSRASVDEAVAAYEPTSTTADDRRLFNDFRSARDAFRASQDQLLRSGTGVGSGSADSSGANMRLTVAFDRGEEALKKLIALNEADAESSVRQIVADVASAQNGVWVSLLAAVALALLCGVTLFRTITHPLAKIAATAKDQQATASEIAATTTEIGATSREISATSKELVKTMTEVSVVAEQTAAIAGNGQAGLTHMEETIRHVTEAAGTVNTRLATLSEKASGIGQVVTTITKVADQTNLLSLNAAIEAEKAAEYGRGFAVVATEIRHLADQTAVATYDIGQMIKDIQSAVSAGVMSMDRFSEEVRRGMQTVQDVSNVLTQVIQQVQALVPRFESVTEGMQAQAVGAEQITEALSQLSEASRQTVESLRQSTAALDELNGGAVGLRRGVSRFRPQVASGGA